MNKQEDIRVELEQLSPLLAELRRKMPAPLVPESYFSGLPEAVLARCASQDEVKALSPLLAAIRQETIKPDVPENYFRSLPAAVGSKLLKAEFSPLPDASKQVHVPAGYFDALPDRVLDKIRHEEAELSRGSIGLPERKGRTVSFPVFSRLALAASFIAAIALGWTHFHKNPAAVNDCQDGIACLSNEEIYDYMSVHSHEFDMQMVQDAVRGTLPETSKKMGIEQKEAAHYIEQHRTVLDVEDASTDIF